MRMGIGSQRASDGLFLGVYRFLQSHSRIWTGMDCTNSLMSFSVDRA
jgi:hypothetical protein